MRTILLLILIFGYLIASLYIGINEYRNLGELSSTYITVQWIVFVISAILTIKLQTSQTILGDSIATLGGGIAMMIVIQAVIFFLLGDVIASSLSPFKIFIIIALGIIISRLAFKYLTRNPKF